MSSPDPQMMEGIAAQCVRLVREEFGRDLDWSLSSLGVLDDVCATLTADGPLTGDRLELWAKLAGASAEPGKSLASFARVLPAISEHARRGTGA